MVSFRDLKNNRSASLKALSDRLTADTRKSGFQEDERIWYPKKLDAAGNGYVKLRFLPSQFDPVPYVRVYSYRFQGPTGKWYIENSLTTPRPSHPDGEVDPVGEYNSKLWATGVPENQDIVRKQSRVTRYYSNVLILEDKLTPENNGKVLIFAYGPKIFEKWQSALFPPEGFDQAPVDPFNLWGPKDTVADEDGIVKPGSNFSIRIKTVKNQRNYDLSAFDPNLSALFEDKDGNADEEKIRAVFEKTHRLSDLLADDKFKSYDALKAKLNKVLDLDSPKANLSSVIEEDVREPEKKTAKIVDDVDENFDEEAFFASLK